MLRKGFFASLFLFVIVFGFVISAIPSQASEFSADILITGPGSEYTYALHVRQNMYRLQKIKGPMNVPPYPSIVNRDTGMTWGLNPQSKQYIEMTDIEKTMSTNPLVGWAMSRKGMTEKSGSDEVVNGYECETRLYMEVGKSEPMAKVWISKKLNHIIREERFALNQKAVMELKNIKEGPLSPSLFEVPEGFTKLDIPDAPSKSVSKDKKRPQGAKVETIEIKKGSGSGRSLDPDRRIIITATGDNPNGSSSIAVLKVQDEKHDTIESEEFQIGNNERRTWHIPAEKRPWSLSLSGLNGRIFFKVEQIAGQGKGAGKEIKPAQPEKAALHSAGPASPRTTEKPASSAAPAGNIMFILDASGSMWGQVEGKHKIVIAKEVLIGLIEDLPEDVNVGLVAYGHRSKGDCNDVEILVPLAVIDKKKLIKTVQGLSPKGKTPITLSVRKTAEKIKQMEDETTIILVSDGKETCEGDPCELVRELKAAGIRFVMHVIGFDVTQEERTQLECMAEVGGGKYYTAGNAGEFLAAAREVVKKSTPAYGILKVKVSKNGRPFHTFITLTHQERGKRWTPGSSSGETGIAELRLAPGTYHAELKDTGVSGGRAPVIYLNDIVITADETVERTADFSDGVVKLKTLRNGVPHGASVYYYHQNEKKHFHSEQTHVKSGTVSRKLLPGMYRIEVKDSGITGAPSVVFDGVKIEPGKEVENTAEFFAGEVTVAATLNGKPYNTPFEVYNSAGKKILNKWTQGRVNGQRLVALAAGTYTIKVKSIKDAKQVKTFENVTIETGEAKTLTATFPLE